MINKINFIDLLSKYRDTLLNLYHNGMNKERLNYVKGSIRICEAQTLYAIIRNFKYKNIIDIGTGNGLSSLYFCKALKDEKINGVVDTIDIVDRKREKKLDKLFKSFGVLNYINFNVGSSTDIVPKLEKMYDFVLIDGYHSYEQSKTDFDNAFKKLSIGGCIAFHDIYKRPHGQKGPRNYLEEIESQNIGEVYYFNSDIFDFFSYPEDVYDVYRITDKWKTYNYSYVNVNANPKELMAIFIKE